MQIDNINWGGICLSIALLKYKYPSELAPPLLIGSLRASRSSNDYAEDSALRAALSNQLKTTMLSEARRYSFHVQLLRSSGYICIDCGSVVGLYC